MKHESGMKCMGKHTVLLTMLQDGHRLQTRKRVLDHAASLHPASGLLSRVPVGARCVVGTLGPHSGKLMDGTTACCHPLPRESLLRQAGRAWGDTGAADSSASHGSTHGTKESGESPGGGGGEHGASGGGGHRGGSTFSVFSVWSGYGEASRLARIMPITKAIAAASRLSICLRLIGVHLIDRQRKGSGLPGLFSGSSKDRNQQAARGEGENGQHLKEHPARAFHGYGISGSGIRVSAC